MLQNLHSSYKLKSTGEILIIKYDTDSQSSRENDNLGLIQLDGGRYINIDEDEHREDENNFDQLELCFEIDVRIYNSSQGSFTLGKQITSQEEYEKANNKISITKETFKKELQTLETAKTNLIGELKCLTQDFTGEVFCYQLYNKEITEELASCYGYYDVESIMNEHGGKENLDEIEIDERTTTTLFLK